MTDKKNLVLPTYDNVVEASRRLAGHAVRTPLLESQLLNDRFGRRLLIKAECLQRTGSFKFRGAFNKLAQIPPERRGNGVVAYSSGNHAQGVAAAARLLDMPATIVMPSDAPRVKRDATEAWGARVVAYDRYREVREAIGQDLAARSGATLVKPYDDPDIMSGQGTVGLELLEQLEEAGAASDCAAVLIPCGGGGLSSGIALALSGRQAHPAIYAVEPEAFDDTARSLTAGRRLANRDEGARSLCDALLAERPGELTFAVNRHLLAGGLTVSDAEALAAIAVAFRLLKLVVEPGGAVGLAAALAERVAGNGTIAVICSGGNVDPEVFADAVLAGADTP